VNEIENQLARTKKERSEKLMLIENLQQTLDKQKRKVRKWTLQDLVIRTNVIRAKRRPQIILIR
jgi:hypothetical protein